MPTSTISLRATLLFLLTSAAWATTSILARPSLLPSGTLGRWRVAFEQTARHPTDRRYSDRHYWEQRYWDFRDQQRYDELRYWERRSGGGTASGTARGLEARHDP